MNKYKFIDVRFIDLKFVQIYEAKFQDMDQLKCHGKEIFVYANISNNLESDEVRVYAHPYKELCCAEDYELREFQSPLKADVLNYFRQTILENRKNIDIERFKIKEK